MRSVLISTIFSFTLIFLFAACGKGSGDVSAEIKGQYQVRGLLSVADSVDHIIVIADHHSCADCDTVAVAADGSFTYLGETSSIDELLLCLPNGETGRLYAVADGEYEVSVDTLSQLAFAAGDTLNGWLQERNPLFADSIAMDIRRAAMDSLCRTCASDVRAALLLREHLLSLQDSIFVRRCLGRLKPEAKPGWLVSSIDYLLTLKGRQPSTLRERLKPLPSWWCWQDSAVYYSLEQSRSESVVLYFWADYDSVSIDSLKMFRQLADQYGLYDRLGHFDRKKGHLPRRIELVSVCLHAADSAAWKEVIASVPGKHCLRQAGFSDVSVSAWRVGKVPCTLVLDRFSTQLGHDIWGKELRQQLDRAAVNTDKPKEKTETPSEPVVSSKPASRVPKGARTESSHY